MRKRLASGFTLLGLWIAVGHGSPQAAAIAVRAPKAPRLQIGDPSLNGGIYQPFTSRWLEF
ncbi:MAG TPA: hypothetical protein VGR67_05985 [Candidatus Polarisedimenticolia bacterium]|nr:hypothetical protein [Candidatus Polarisedimenticolia bacterium]